MAKARPCILLGISINDNDFITLRRVATSRVSIVLSSAEFIGFIFFIINNLASDQKS